MHDDFILTPLSEIVNEAIISCSGLGFSGIKLRDYVRHALLLRLTGALEQKCKCISWEIATYDFIYRYENFEKNSQLGYSGYQEKSKLAKYMFEKIHDVEYSSIIQKCFCECKKYFDDSIFPSDFADWFGRDSKSIADSVVELQKVLVVDTTSGKKMKKTLLREDNNQNALYEKIYRTRNSYAHNTKCYQAEKTSFADLSSLELTFSNNCLAWFFTLLYIDLVFIESYKKTMDRLRVIL
jgi:hypothetical protein